MNNDYKHQRCKLRRGKSRRPRPDPEKLTPCLDASPRPKTLNPSQLDWPDEIANSVEAVEFHDGGGVKRVRFAGKAAARRTILEQTGKLKSPAGDGLDALAEAIRADQARYSKA